MMETFIADRETAYYMFEHYKEAADCYNEIEPTDIEMWAEAIENKVRISFVGNFYDNMELETLTGEISFIVDVDVTNEDELCEAAYDYDKVIDTGNTLEGV